MNSDIEFSATEIRKILQGLFPQRRLVLSQFTFFNQVGVARPTGSSYRRGRRCYRLQDILSIACILALKEEGIPYKNVETLPAIIQNNSDKIFFIGEGCSVSGYGTSVALNYPGEGPLTETLNLFLEGSNDPLLYWSFDVGLLACQLRSVAEQYVSGMLDRAAA